MTDADNDLIAQTENQINYPPALRAGGSFCYILRTRLDEKHSKVYHKYITTNRGAENGRNKSGNVGSCFSSGSARPLH